MICAFCPTTSDSPERHLKEFEDHVREHLVWLVDALLKAWASSLSWKRFNGVEDSDCVSPIIVQVKSMLGTESEWLYFILEAFNAGDLTKYQELCRVYNAALTAQPALVENEKKLWEKINILCLMELIFRLVVLTNTSCQSFPSFLLGRHSKVVR